MSVQTPRSGSVLEEPDPRQPARGLAARLKAALKLATDGFLIGKSYGIRENGACACPNPNCKAPGKHGGTGWKDLATTDEATIRNRFLSGDPSYMVIPPEGSGLVIIDEDIPGTLDALGPLPKTLVIQTGHKDGGGRGRHLYGKLPEGISETEVPYLWQGGEIRRGGNGGVVGPHCLHRSGVTYDPVVDAPVATLPVDWVRAVIESGARRTRGQDAAHGPEDDGWEITEPGRHLWLVARAGQLRRAGLDEQALRGGLAYLNTQRCRPVLDEDEVDEIFAWARTKEGDPGPGQKHLAVLRFYSPVELGTITLEQPDWIVHPALVAAGAITEIDGKVKAAGKTTLVIHMVRAIVDGHPFLGMPTRRTKVVYVTEQTRQTFADALRRAGLGGRGTELLVLFREDIGSTPWPAVVAATDLDGYDVVVFDTLGKLAGIREENSAGEWATAMTPLQDLAAKGKAVIVARHDRKSGGEVGDSGRGSSQASGDVDIILALKRPEGNQRPTRRVIESLSRYPATPTKIVVELGDDGYTLLGDHQVVAAIDARAFLSAALAEEFRQNGSGLVMKDLAALGQARVPPISRTTIQAALAEMSSAGEVIRSGKGAKGDPHVFTASSVLPEVGSYGGSMNVMSARPPDLPDFELGGAAVDQADGHELVDLVEELLYAGKFAGLGTVDLGPGVASGDLERTVRVNLLSARKQGWIGRVARDHLQTILGSVVVD